MLEDQHLDKCEAQQAKQPAKQQPRMKPSNPRTKMIMNCKFRGQSHKMGKKYCPASGTTCAACEKGNHFAAVCRTTDECSEDAEDADALFLGDVRENELKPWTVPLKVGGTPVVFKIDTGADVNVMGAKAYEKLKWKSELKPAAKQLKSPGGEVKCRGTFSTHTRYKDKCHKMELYVVEGLDRNLLSRSMAVQMGLVRRLDEAQEEAHMPASPLPTMLGEPVTIHLREDAQPYSVHCARRVALPLLPAGKKELERMVKSEIIEPVTEPSDWCAPIVPVVKHKKLRKKTTAEDEVQVRICIDFKKLNKFIKRETYQLPIFEELLLKMSGAKFFSLLDASSGFWQLPLAEGSRHLTTFITPVGRFRMKRLPFGISIAPEVYQERMHRLLKDCPGVVCYLDDVLVYGATEQEHDMNLKRVMKIMKDGGLTLNMKK